MPTSRVLVVSAHRGEIDRRILAEANSLAESEREVTLVSVPAHVPPHCLHPAVRLVAPPLGARSAGNWLLKAAYASAKAALRGFKPLVWARRMRAQEQYFLDHTPIAPYDVIHCHDLETLPAAEAVRKRLAPSAKLIYDAHELYPYQFVDRSAQQHWARIEEQTIGFPDLVITVNDSIAEQMATLYKIRRPAVIFSSYGTPANPEPLTLEAFYQHFGTSPGGFRVIFQGGLSPLRNLPTLVRAFGSLDPSFRLFILGAGPLEAKMRRIASDSGRGNVYFGGHIPQGDLLRFTGHADLGVIPYEDAGLLNMRYCTPNKLFEFIEARVPICTSDLPELTRFATEYGIGAAYPMHSADEIATAIRDCRGRCERGEFTPEARATAQRTFAWSEQRKRLIGLYESLGV